MAMKSVKTEMEYSERSCRIEMLVRVVYSFILLGIFAILSSTILPILVIIHGVHMIILGKRHITLHRLLKTIILYGSRTNYYAFLLVDERPPLIPELEEA